MTDGIRVSDNMKHWDIEDCTFHQTGWQSIETAPKDGTDILGYVPKAFFDGEWNHFEGRFVSARLVLRWIQDGPRGGWELAPCNRSYYNPDFEPTHWQPLPDPPVQVPFP